MGTSNGVRGPTTVTLLLLTAGTALVAFIGCREPMADDPGYRATVMCVQKMKARSEAGQGTRNDSKASCIGWVGDRIRANPNGDYSAFADCVLSAPDEAAATKCK